MFWLKSVSSAMTFPETNLNAMRLTPDSEGGTDQGAHQLDLARDRPCLHLINSSVGGVCHYSTRLARYLFPS
jgi:hypothetical protein